MSNDFTLLSDEDLDRYLKECLAIIQEAKKQPILSDTAEKARQLAKQRIAKNRLIVGIMHSQRLSKQNKWRGLANFEDIYNEALQLTLLEIWEKLDSYQPEYSVMAWVNQLFNYRLIDIVNQSEKRGITNVPKNQGSPKVRAIDELTREIPSMEPEMTQEQQIREIVESDPEGYLRKQAIGNHPHVNLQIVLSKLLDGKKWQEISDELDVPLSSASSFYQRRLHNIVAYIQKYI